MCTDTHSVHMVGSPGIAAYVRSIVLRPTRYSFFAHCKKIRA